VKMSAFLALHSRFVPVLHVVLRMCEERDPGSPYRTMVISLGKLML